MEPVVLGRIGEGVFVFWATASVVWFLAVAVWLLSAGIGKEIGKKKGCEWTGLALGSMLPVLGVFIVAALPPAEVTMECPHCRSDVRPGALVCPACGHRWFTE